MNPDTLICKHTQFNYLEIWSPKYSTKQVLLACRKVGNHNKIIFTKAASLGTEPYYLSGATIRKHPEINNGSIPCFAVPLSELRLLQLSKCQHDI